MCTPRIDTAGGGSGAEVVLDCLSDAAALALRGELLDPRHRVDVGTVPVAPPGPVAFPGGPTPILVGSPPGGAPPPGATPSGPGPGLPPHAGPLVGAVEGQGLVRLSTRDLVVAGVTEPMIAEIVRRFYGRVRADDLLGPMFESRIDDWEAHLAKLCDFWSSVLLMTGRFKGAPMAAHVRIEGLGAGHFERWLGLWRQTAREVCPPAAAALFIARAEMIARSFQLGISVARGELPPQGSSPAGAADQPGGRQDQQAAQDEGRPTSDP